MYTRTYSGCELNSKIHYNFILGPLCCVNPSGLLTKYNVIPSGSVFCAYPHEHAENPNDFSDRYLLYGRNVIARATFMEKKKNRIEKKNEIYFYRINERGDVLTSFRHYNP